MSRQESKVNIFVSILITLIFLANQLYAGDYLSPKSNPPSQRVLRHLRVVVAGARPEIKEIAFTWNSIEIGLQTEVKPSNIRPKGVLPEATLRRMNQALRLIKERSASRRYRDFFNLKVHPGKGLLGKLFSQRYLLQNLVFFEGPFLADMSPGYNSELRTAMLNLILFSDLVKSIETLVFVLRHEMDHTNRFLTEREIQDRDIPYFNALPKTAQDEIIDDLGRIEEAVSVVQDSILADIYKQRTGEDCRGKLKRYREVLYNAQREGLSEKTKDALREFIGMKRCKVESFDGVPISYTVGGNLDSSITLLFVHGWTSQNKDWRRQIAEFENEYKIVTVEPRGFGKSGQGDYSKERLPHISDWVKDVEAVIEEERLNNVVVLGHSMGGMIGFELALESDSVIGFIPIATPVTSPSTSFINVFFRGLLKRLDPVFKTALPLLTRPKVVALLDRVQRRWLRNNSLLEALARIPSQWVGLDTHDTEDFHHLWTNSVGETNLRDWLIGYLAMCTHDVRDRLKNIEVPVLWIIGGKDLVVNPEVQAKDAEMIPGAGVLTLKKSRHFPHWEEPEKTNSAIREFLEHEIIPVISGKMGTREIDEELSGLESTGRFKEVTTWQGIDNYIKGLIRAGKRPERILVDLDMTVFAPLGFLGSNPWFGQRIEEIGRYHALWEWGDQERRMARHGFYHLVEPQIPEIIEKWKAQGIEVVGFTAREWVKDSYRTKQILNKLGIRFSHITSVPKIYYDGGVIYTHGSGERKARALRQLTKESGSGPNVLIDDTRVNVTNILQDEELQNTYGLLYRSPVLEQLLETEAQEYIRLAEEALTQGQFDFAIEYYFNAAEQARFLDTNQKSSIIQKIWRIVAQLDPEGRDTEELVRFLIQQDETKCDLRVMDERLKDPYLNLLAKEPPVTDPEKSRVLFCQIDESTDLNSLKYALRMVRGVRKQNSYPKFRMVLTSSLPSDRMRRKMRKADLIEKIDYDFWFVPKEGEILPGVLRKRFEDLASVTESDIVTINATEQALSSARLIYEGIAEVEGYDIPIPPDTEVSPFSRINLIALRENARRKVEFLAGHEDGKPIVLFYHTDGDGVAAAGAETKFLRKYFGDNINIVYVPINRHEPLPMEEIPQDALWIVLDFGSKEFSEKLISAGIVKKEILFQDHHDEEEPEIPDGVIYIGPRGLGTNLDSGQYPAGLLTITVNGEVLRQGKNLVSAALYLERTNWLGALAIYGDYCGSTWSEYLSKYGLDTVHLDELSRRITAVATVNPGSAELALRDIISLSEPSSQLSPEFESQAERLYQHLAEVIDKIDEEPIIFYHLTPEDLAVGDISKMLADHLKATFGCDLVVVGTEKRIGNKRALVLRARSTDINAGELMQEVSPHGGGHAKAGGARIELKDGENSVDVFKEIQNRIMVSLSPEQKTLDVPQEEVEIIADIGTTWNMYGDGWEGIAELKDIFRKAIDAIVDSGEFRREDFRLIKRITLVSHNDKLVACDRAKGQVVIDIRSFNNEDVLRLELIRKLWYLKLDDLRHSGKLAVINLIVEEMFIILNQIQNFMDLNPEAQSSYLDALAEDTDESERGLYEILIRVKKDGFKDVHIYYPMLLKLVLRPKAFNFSAADVKAFKELSPDEIANSIEILFQLKDIMRSMGEPTEEVLERVTKRYKETRSEITSVIRLLGKGRVPRGTQQLAKILFRPDGAVKESDWKKWKRKFTGTHLKILQEVFWQVAEELKDKFMQINVEELEIFKNLEVIVVQDSDHLIYYKEEGGKKQFVIDRKAFYSKELLLIELERIIGESLMRSMTGKLPPARLEVVYTLYLSVERFLRFPNSKQEEILRVLKDKFPENKKFYQLLSGVKGKDLSDKSDWEEAIERIMEFILEKGIYPEDVQEALSARSLDRIKRQLWIWIQLIEAQIQIDLAFKSRDPQMRNLALGYLVENAHKLRFKETIFDSPDSSVALGSIRFKLGNITESDSSIKCLRFGSYPDRLILVNGQGKFLLV